MSAPTTPPRPTLLHVCGRFLPLSETFTYDLIAGLDGCTHHVVASTREHEDVFPWPSVHAPAAEAAVWPIVQDLGVDAVLCHFGPQCTRGMAIGAMLDVPVATIFHGYDISRLLRDRLWVERYRACFAAGMRALCISEAGRRKLLDIGCAPGQVDVIRLGVDTARFVCRPPAVRWDARRPLRLLTVARLVQKKGVHVALAAAAVLEALGVPCEWRIVGAGPEREALLAQAVGLALTQVRWDGEVPRGQAAQAFAWADLYVQPSVTAESGDEEGIPVSLMEAMAAGLPVVSTRHSGIPELVLHERTGLLTDEGDADGLASAIMRLRDHPALASVLAQAARRHVVLEFDQHRQLGRVAAWVTGTLLGEGRTPLTYRAQRRTGRGLIVQALDAGLLARKLTLLAHRHPGLRFDVLSSDSTSDALAALPYVASIRAIDTADTACGDGPPYDLAVVPFSDDTGAAEQWAVALAQRSGAARVVGLTMRDRQVALDEGRS